MNEKIDNKIACIMKEKIEEEISWIKLEIKDSQRKVNKLHCSIKQNISGGNAWERASYLFGDAFKIQLLAKKIRFLDSRQKRLSQIAEGNKEEMLEKLNAVIAQLEKSIEEIKDGRGSEDYHAIHMSCNAFNICQCAGALLGDTLDLRLIAEHINLLENHKEQLLQIIKDVEFEEKIYKMDCTCKEYE